MIPVSSKLRVARPADDLTEITNMYIRGLGFRLLCEFKDHDGFDGMIIGHPGHPYHLEFTKHKGTHAVNPPGRDNLLVFYVPEEQEWINCCREMVDAGFRIVESFNPYWDVPGKTFEDTDGYRVVLQNRSWDV